ncbi:MAG: AarF/ABC1/UbiB kinase family protein [Pseudomonadota bacterium]
MAREDNRLTGRVKRYAKVGAGIGGVAAKYAGNRLLGREGDQSRQAAELKAALGGLKGPIMKVAQMVATIPEAVPEEFATELAQLQANAPPMGWAFVRRRMAAELGPDWRSRFGSFEREAAAAASLGQVHRAEDTDGAPLACKLQYPDMQSAVEADLQQLKVVFSIYRRMDSAIDPTKILEEIGERLREELDYDLEARHMALYRQIFAGTDRIVVPEAREDLSTQRLLTMSWLEGKPLLSFKDAPEAVRNQIAETMFEAWWFPFGRYGVIHGDPHLGNYTVRGDAGDGGINLLDFGCIRKFPPEFVEGGLDLYHAIQRADRDLAVSAYEKWGFQGLTNDLIDALNIWAEFIYGPLLKDKVQRIAEGVSPGEYGRESAFKVHKRLKELGTVTPPREFVFMDRAAIGLGGVFIHLDARLNFYRLFNETIGEFSRQKVASDQDRALGDSGLPPVGALAA